MMLFRSCAGVREYGEPGINGGPRGDLLVEVIVSGSRDFERQDVNIFSKASISYAIAALGGDIRIKTVDGDIIYTVAPGTQTGTRIRLKGKGVPSTRNKAIKQCKHNDRTKGIKKCKHNDRNKGIKTM